MTTLLRIAPITNLRSKSVLAGVLLAHACVILAFIGTQIKLPATAPAALPANALVVRVVDIVSPTVQTSVPYPVQNSSDKAPEQKPIQQKELPRFTTSQPAPFQQSHSSSSSTPSDHADATPLSASAVTSPSITTTSSSSTTLQTAPKFDADYLDNPAPTYPSLSRRAGEEGKVVLRVFVEASGLPSKVDVSTSSGFERLDKSAASTVARWKFIPARQGSDAIGAWVLVPIIFGLKN